MTRDSHHPRVTLSEHDRVRYLHLDTPWVQGAMNLDNPRAIELEYVRRMMAWTLWRDSAVLTRGHAVQLGLGAGAITRFTRQVMKMRTSVVELNPDVVAANRMWFRLPREDARFRIVVGDARAWVEDASNLQSVDVLCVDLYDPDAAAPVLDDEPFYAACRAVLVEGGVMSVNLFGRKAGFAGSAARLSAAFGLDQCWELTPTREGNTVVVAARNVVVPTRDILESRAATIENSFGLPARKWLRMIKPLTLDAR
jgi:spermidine synthase